MLTKKEREEISKRFGECDDVGFYDIYTAITGKKVPSRTTRDEDFTEISNVILDLCDTSNMLELPLDKDGKVICIGDTVYDNNGEKYKVTGYKTLFENTNIILSNGSEVAYTEKYPHNLVHKQPVIIELLVARIKRVMDDGSTTVWAYDELDDIIEQLETLGYWNE